jgi:hypothetical protein
MIMTKEEYMKKAYSVARQALLKNKDEYDHNYLKHIAECMALHCLWLLDDGRDSDGRVITEQWLDAQWSELCATNRPVAPYGGGRGQTGLNPCTTNAA